MPCNAGKTDESFSEAQRVHAALNEVPRASVEGFLHVCEYEESLFVFFLNVLLDEL